MIVLANLTKVDGNIIGGQRVMPMLFILTLTSLKLVKAGFFKCGLTLSKVIEHIMCLGLLFRYLQKVGTFISTTIEMVHFFQVF